jgi:hypothetical protein
MALTSHQIPAEWLATAEMQNFKPSRSSYRCDQPKTLIPLASIEPPKRDAGVIFDANGFKRDRVMKILAGIKDDANILPVKIVEGGPPFRLYDGFHRFYASLAAGFSHIPAVVVASLPK